MRVIIHNTDGLEDFLSGIVVNAACFWTANLQENLQFAQRNGTALWEFQGGKPLNKSYLDYKLASGGHPGVNDWSGQLRAQATFADGDATLSYENSTVKQEVHARPWKPIPGEPIWIGQGNGPFDAINGAWGRTFWVPGNYVNKNINVDILKSTAPETVDLASAGEYLRIPVSDTKSILSGQTINTGSWTDNNLTGGAALSWH